MISTQRWHIGPLVITHLVAALLLASWLWEPTRHLWDLFDDVILEDMNATLAQKSAWSAFWAILNIRVFDILTGLTMLVPLLRRELIPSDRKIRDVFFTFLVLLMLMLALRIGFTTIASHYDFGAHRSSPSLLHEGAIRLTELYPDWNVKDSSNSSFPGDHASVLLLWAMYLSFFARGKRLLVIWAMAFFYMLPRLYAGAHWGSDDFVGGLFVAILAIGWGCFTPLASNAGKWVAAWLGPYLDRLNQVPILRRLAIVTGD